jgi:hypothetical protein
VLLLVCLRAPSVEAAYRVTGLSFQDSPRDLSILVRTDGPVRYDYFTMHETQPQVVIDLDEAVHALDRRRFEPPVNDFLQRVRTSQYRPYPHPVVRIVLDLEELAPFQITPDDRGLVITVTTSAAEREIQGNSPEEEAVRRREAPAPEPAVTHRAEPQRSADPKPAQQVPSQTASSSPETPSLEASPPESAAMESVSAVPARTVTDTAASSGERDPLISRLLALGVREPVSYHGGGRRDPFVPLPAQQEPEFGQTPLPDVEKLSIVGILQGVDGYRALAQDDEDNGYVLRKGDRVLYGYVARIEAERVIFYLNRRGLDRTVILKIPQ